MTCPEERLFLRKEVSERTRSSASRFMQVPESLPSVPLCWLLRLAVVMRWLRTDAISKPGDCSGESGSGFEPRKEDCVDPNILDDALSLNIKHAGGYSVTARFFGNGNRLSMRARPIRSIKNWLTSWMRRLRGLATWSGCNRYSFKCLNQIARANLLGYRAAERTGCILWI